MLKKLSFLVFFLFVSLFSSAQEDKTITRILFIFDASQSMFGHFSGQPKIDVAQKLLSEALDSLRNIPNTEVALRVYGNRFSINNSAQNCEDTHLEVPFAPDNIDDIKHFLKQIKPKGTTPIARSLELTQEDFTPCSNCKNVIILITDGIEACDGDPCAVARALRANNVALKPFIIGLGVLEDYKKHFYCIGNYYDVKDKETFKTVLGLVLDEALNNTSCQVNLLDVNGKPIETNVNMSFYDAGTGELKYNFIHTMNYAGLPDTLSIDPAIKYNIEVHTIPKVVKENVALIPGQHNVIPIETPQGTLVFEANGRKNRMNNISAIVKEEDGCEILNNQNFSRPTKYLVGTYDVEILTIPRIKTKVEIAQSKETKIEIPEPGVFSIRVAYKGYGDIYVLKDGKQELVYKLDVDAPSESIQLLPGNYKIVFRSINSNRAFYTVEKDFTIISGKSVSINL